MMAGLLADILAEKRRWLGELRVPRSSELPSLRPVRLRRPAGAPLRLITEIKRRSPSAGALSTKLGVAERAAAYERAGACMVSVLCDTPYFDGGYDHLSLARAACSLPLLCKDFIIDERQLELARAHGADAALLIVRCLSRERLIDLMRTARSLELVPFVEVATLDEAHLAVDAGAELIGVNARDLDTLAMDSTRAHQVLEALPASVTRVHLSGVKSPNDVERVTQGGADAALIGEVLMRHDDPEPLLRTLVSAAGNSHAG